MGPSQEQIDAEVQAELRGAGEAMLSGMCVPHDRSGIF